MAKIIIKGKNFAWAKTIIYFLLSLISLVIIFLYGFHVLCDTWGTILMSVAASLIGAVLLSVLLDLTQHNTNKKLLSASLWEFNNTLLKGLREVAEKLCELFPQKYFLKTKKIKKRCEVTCNRLILQIKDDLDNLRGLFYDIVQNDVVKKIKRSIYWANIRKELNDFAINNKNIVSNFAMNGLCNESACFTLQEAINSFVLQQSETLGQSACYETDFIEFCKDVVELQEIGALKILGISKFKFEK